MLPDIQPGNTKILYFFNCLLDGMHTNLYCLSYFSFLCDLSEKIQNKNISDNVCSDIYFPVCLYRTAF